MKKLTLVTALLPTTALAHGGHAPVPEAAHGATHAAPILVVAVIAVATGLALVQRWRS